METKNTLPLNSRVWIYQSNREFSESESKEIMILQKDFVCQWASHGTLLNSAAELFYNRFIVFFVDEQVKDATGCSIDKSVAFVKQVEQQYGVSLMDRLNLAYRENNEIKTLKMVDFQNQIKKGLINENTLVFNNLIQTKQEFLNAWEVPAKNSWHQNLFLIKH